MSRRTKHKIATDGVANVFGSRPFDALNDNGLPAGPSSVSVPRARTELPSGSRGRVEVRREKAGRGGKTVTTLREFSSHVPLKDLEILAFNLKKTCACGGTLKGRAIELQGEVCDLVIGELKKLGYQPVRAGG